MLRPSRLESKGNLGYSVLRARYSPTNHYTNGLKRPLTIRGLLISPFPWTSAENVDNKSASIRKCKTYLSWENIVRICIMDSVVLPHFGSQHFQSSLTSPQKHLQWKFGQANFRQIKFRWYLWECTSHENFICRRNL